MISLTEYFSYKTERLNRNLQGNSFVPYRRKHAFPMGYGLYIQSGTRSITRKQNALPTVPIFWTFVILHLLIRKGQLYSRTSALKPMLEM